jgi:hypothetical protein
VPGIETRIQKANIALLAEDITKAEKRIRIRLCAQLSRRLPAREHTNLKAATNGTSVWYNKPFS